MVGYVSLFTILSLYITNTILIILKDKYLTGLIIVIMYSSKVSILLALMCSTLHISSGSPQEDKVIYKPGRLWYSTKYPR